jgi:hypothetical protein
MEKLRGAGAVFVVHEREVKHIKAVFFGGRGNIVGEKLSFAHAARGKQRECVGYAAFQATEQGSSQFGSGKIERVFHTGYLGVGLAIIVLYFV